MRRDVALWPPQNHHSYPQTSPHRSRQAWLYRTCHMHVIRGTSETYIHDKAGKGGMKRRVLSCHICMLWFLQGSDEQISSGRFAGDTRDDTELGGYCSTRNTAIKNVVGLACACFTHAHMQSIWRQHATSSRMSTWCNHCNSKSCVESRMARWSISRKHAESRLTPLHTIRARLEPKSHVLRHCFLTSFWCTFLAVEYSFLSHCTCKMFSTFRSFDSASEKAVGFVELAILRAAKAVMVELDETSN